jgi:hypothetical protein
MRGQYLGALALAALGSVVLAPDCTAAQARALTRRPSLVAAPSVRYALSKDPLTATSTLTARNSIGPLSFGDAGISGDTIAAYSVDLQDPLAPTGVYAFTEPAVGWAAGSSSAQLTAADGSRLDNVAVSGRTVAVGDAAIGAAQPVAVYLFTEPSGGWSGALHQSATLLAPAYEPSAEPPPSVAISGDTVFASDGSAVYAFTEPAGGWSGTVPTSALLTAPDGASLESIAASGQTLLAGSTKAVYVFTEPSNGWTGYVHPTARLAPSSDRFGGFAGPVAISGATVVASADSVDEKDGLAATYVFTRPAAGWSGTEHEVATLTYTYLQGEFGNAYAGVGVSSGTVAFMMDGGSVGQEEHTCPCRGVLYAVLAPPGGWSGTTQINLTASVSPIENPDVSVAGRTVVVGAGNGVHVLTGLPPLTSISGVALTRLATGAPRLRFELRAGTGAAGVKTLTLGLPRGLGFTNKHTRLAGAVHIAGASQSTVTLRHRALLVTIRHPANRLTVTIGSAAWGEAPELSRQLASLTKPGHARRLELALPVRVTTATGEVTQASLGIALTR